VAREEEASLLLVKVVIEHSLAAGEVPKLCSLERAAALGVEVETTDKNQGAPGVLRSGNRVLIREEKVLMHLGMEEEKDAPAWVLDTGATNHMSGAWAAFKDLNKVVYGIVRDDSKAWIEGRGTIVFICKNGQRRSFIRVYYIPWLTTNIISIGQLDEASYKLDIHHGFMKIRELGGQLLASVKRQIDQLYVLYITMAQSKCLLLKGGEDVWQWHARLGHITMASL
jgi:hypothetical protein